MNEPGTRMCGLDLLRAIAVVWVMLFHSYLIGGLGEGWEWLSRYGWMGVDLFFVLSGFLIGSQVLQRLTDGRPMSFGDFYLRRAFRILPAFWTMLALYCVFPQIREAPGLEPAWKFLPSSSTWPSTTGPTPRSPTPGRCAWKSISTLCSRCWRWAQAAGSGRGRCCCSSQARWRPASPCAAACGCTTTAWIRTCSCGPWFVEDIYYPTWNRLDGLLAGVVLTSVRVFRPQAWSVLQRRGNGLLLLGLAIVAAAMWLFADRVGLLGNTLGWPVLSLGMALLVLVAAGPGSVIGRVVVPGAGWLAGASYSLYLSHKAVFHLVDTHAGALLEGRGLQAFAVYALATLLAGAALHYAVERPFLHVRVRLQKRAAGRTALPAQTPA